jgi:DNA-binding phage protein
MESESMDLIRQYADRNLKEDASRALHYYLASRHMTVAQVSHETGMTSASLNRILEKKVNDLVALRKLMVATNKAIGTNKIFQL